MAYLSLYPLGLISLDKNHHKLYTEITDRLYLWTQLIKINEDIEVLGE